MQAIGESVPGEQGGRPVLRQNGQTRIALPMAYVDVCATSVEKEFLWRFLEAWDFVNGYTDLFDSDGEPRGRYSAHAERVDPDTYIKTEIQAYRWVRQYGLGKEWAQIADMYLHMMSADRAKVAMVDWGHYLVKDDNEYIALGGAMVSVKLLGLRLKDAYREFFRWYRYVQDCQQRGEEPTGKGAFESLERERRIALEMRRFKQAQGLTSETEAAEQET